MILLVKLACDRVQWNQYHKIINDTRNKWISMSQSFPKGKEDQDVDADDIVSQNIKKRM